MRKILAGNNAFCLLDPTYYFFSFWFLKSGLNIVPIMNMKAFSSIDLIFFKKNIPDLCMSCRMYTQGTTAA